MSVPAIPVIPAPEPVAVPVTEHTRVDQVQNRIAAKLAQARTPMPGQPITPATQPGQQPGQPLQPPLSPVPAIPPAPPATTPAAAAAPGSPDPSGAAAPAPAAEPAPAEIDLASIDFDAPPKTDTPTDPAATPAETPAAAQEPDSVRELAETLARGDVPEKVEEVFLRTARGRQMLTSFKALRDLAQPPEKGGIGRVPTMEEIKEADLSHRDAMAMKHEFENDPLSFANNLFTVNPETGRTFLGEPDKAARVLEAIPHALFQAAQATNSPVYANMLAAYSAPVFSRFFDYQYSQALAMPEETPQQIQQYRQSNQIPPLLDDKIRMLDALQISEFKAFGKARPMTWTPGRPVNNGTPMADPEKADLLERLRQSDQVIAQGRQQQVQAINNQIDSASRAAVMGDIETVLKVRNIDKIYPPAVIRSQQTEILNELAALLPAHDPSGWQRYQIQHQQASRGQATPEQVAKTYRQLFQNALRHAPQVTERLNDLVKGAKSHVDAQHASRTESQYRTEPNGAGVPASASVVSGQQLARQSGESLEDYNTRRILAARQRATATPAR